MDLQRVRHQYEAFIYSIISIHDNDPRGKWRLEKKPWPNEVLAVSVSAVRETTYYMTILIIPLLFIHLVAVASVAFPSGSSIRPNTLLTVILAYCFFQSVVASVLPHSREDSLIGLYLMWAMVSATAQLLVSFLLIAFNAKAQDCDIPPLPLRQVVIRYPNCILRFLHLNHRCKSAMITLPNTA